MHKDFYLNDRSTAAYFEKDWYDFVDRPEVATKFAYAPFSPGLISCAYHQQLVERLRLSLERVRLEPRRMLEVGSALGRTFFEVCRQVPSVEQAELIEPSQNLWRVFNSIFSGPEPVPVHALKGNVELHAIEFSTAPIRAACAHVDWTCENKKYQDLRPPEGGFDLTICSNVIDQCEDPHRLVTTLKAATAPGGICLLSCTYQWQNKYVGNASKPIRDIQDLFGRDWEPLSETNIPFEFRVNERHWMKFLSHACVFRRD